LRRGFRALGSSHWRVTAHAFYFGDTRPLLRAIAEFLGDTIEEVEQLPPDSAKFPSTSETVQGILRREGEFWTIACWGEVFRLRDVRGLGWPTLDSILLHESNMTHRPRLAPPSSSIGARDSLAEMIFRRYATVITSAELLETLG
jgi:hypothetical protein